MCHTDIAKANGFHQAPGAGFRVGIFVRFFLFPLFLGGTKKLLGRLVFFLYDSSPSKIICGK